MSGLSLSIGLMLAQAPVSPYSPEANAYFAAMATQPDAARKALINDLIAGLIADGVWARLDCLFLLASHTSQAGLLNAINPAQAATAVSSPTFTTDRGFSTDGAASYVDTGFNPATANGLFSQNLAYFGIWVNSEQQGGNAGWFDGTDGVTIGPRNVTDTIVGRINQATTISAPAPDTSSKGWTSVQRLNAASERIFRNSVAVNAGTTASTALNSNDLYLGRSSATAFSAGTFAACAIGNLNSIALNSALYARLNTYLTAIGGT